MTQQDCIYALAAYAQEALACREVAAALKAENEALKAENDKLRTENAAFLETNDS